MRIAWTLLVLAACGGGGGGGGDDTNLVAPTTCAYPGSGEVFGSVGDVSFAGVSGVGANLFDSSNGVQITILDTGETCGTTFTHRLSLFVCSNPPASGTFDIGASLGCSGDTAGAQLESNNGASSLTATGGSITIDMGSDGGCLTGTFHAEFDGGTLDGAFGGDYCRSSGGS